MTTDNSASDARERDKLWHLIAKNISCENECQAYPTGCGCAQNAADAILAAGWRLPAATADQWQPIETAPKDGTPIWLYREDSDAFLGRWIAPCDFLNEAEYDGVQGWDDPDWFFADFVSGGRVTDGAPTHWQSTPAPPALTDKRPSSMQEDGK